MGPIQFSKINQTYWNNGGRYHKEYIFLYDHFDLGTKEAETVHAKLVKILSVLLREYFVNENVNAVEMEQINKDAICIKCHGTGFINQDTGESCTFCHGSGYLIDVLDSDLKRITPPFEYMFRFLDEIVDDVIEVTQAIKTQMKKPVQTYSIIETVVYTILCDLVMYYVLSTEDSKLD